MNSHPGYCTVCEDSVNFLSKGDWHRDQLVCEKCNSIPRERALAYVLSREVPKYKFKRIHESSPADRGISAKLAKICKKYSASQYYPHSDAAKVDGFFNVNLENQPFKDFAFDVFISLDVMEHVFDPESAIKEIYRTLSKTGVAIMTFPIKKNQTTSSIQRAKMSNGVLKNILKPEFHGNPIDPSGSLVTVDYGYEIHQELGRWAPFNVEIIRFNRSDIGVIGEYTEVVVLRK